MGNGGEVPAACNETPLSSFRARELRAQLGMGWVKLVLGVGVAAYSYRSVTHVNSLVRQVTVPKYSLLAKHTQNKKKSNEYKDAFKISLPPHYRMLKGTGSQHEIFVHDLAKQFFTSKVFSRLEGPLIKFSFMGQMPLIGTDLILVLPKRA